MHHILQFRYPCKLINIDNEWVTSLAPLGRGKVFRLWMRGNNCVGKPWIGHEQCITCPHTYIPESLGSVSRGQLTVRDRGNGLKAQPVVYRWTNEAGWTTSNEVVRMKAINHEPMNRPKGTLHPSGRGGGQTRYEALNCSPLVICFLFNI